MDVVPETELKVGDRVMLTRDLRWPGVAKAKHTRVKDADLVPAGAVGRLAVQGGMWVVRFDHYKAADEWPCLIGSHPAKLPPWIIKEGGAIRNIPVSETLSDQELCQLTWNM